MASKSDAEIVDEVVDAFNRHDADGVMKHFADDAEFYSSAGPEIHGQRFSGKAAVRQAVEARFAAVPDLRWSDAETWICPDGIASRWRATGTQADGKKLDSWGCDFWKLRDGKVILKDTYYKIRT